MQGENTFSRLNLFKVSEAAASAEFRLQQEWNNLKPESKLRLSSGKEMLFLSPGEWNTEAGPDFKNAKIRINNSTVCGDVEVHWNSSDWFRHGHHKNPAYSNVILHVVSCDDSETPSAIPVLILHTNMHDNEELDIKRENLPGRCSSSFNVMSNSESVSLFSDAGLERFDKKSDDALKNIIETGSQRAALKGFLNTSGYKSNRAEFAELFRRFASYPYDLQQTAFSAILWGESGLLPDPARHELDKDCKDFVKHIWDIFWKIRICANPPISFKNNSSRPYNSPERRLAALIIIMQKNPAGIIRYLMNKITAFTNPKDFALFLIAELQTQDIFWDTHINFYSSLSRPAALCGKNHAVNLAVNTVMPLLAAEYKLAKDQAAVSFIKKAWAALPAEQDNKIMRMAIRRFFGEHAAERKQVFSNTASVQGLIHIHKNYCEKLSGNCFACPFSGQ